jgi:hypothetical protein
MRPRAVPGSIIGLRRTLVSKIPGRSVMSVNLTRRAVTSHKKMLPPLERRKICRCRRPRKPPTSAPEVYHAIQDVEKIKIPNITFLHLPPEIRNTIYEMTWNISRPISFADHQCFEVYSSTNLIYPRSNLAYSFSGSSQSERLHIRWNGMTRFWLILSNKQIHQEVYSLMTHKSSVHIFILWRPILEVPLGRWAEVWRHVRKLNLRLPITTTTGRFGLQRLADELHGWEKLKDLSLYLEFRYPYGKQAIMEAECLSLLLQGQKLDSLTVEFKLKFPEHFERKEDETKAGITLELSETEQKNDDLAPAFKFKIPQSLPDEKRDEEIWEWLDELHTRFRDTRHLESYRSKGAGSFSNRKTKMVIVANRT